MGILQLIPTPINSVKLGPRIKTGASPKVEMLSWSFDFV